MEAVVVGNIVKVGGFPIGKTSDMSKDYADGTRIDISYDRPRVVIISH